MAALASSVLHSPLQICSSDCSSSGFLSPSRIHGFAPSFKLKCSSRRPLLSGDGRPRRSFYLKSASDSPPSLDDDSKANSELLASLKLKLLVGLSFASHSSVSIDWLKVGVNSQEHMKVGVEDCWEGVPMSGYLKLDNIILSWRSVIPNLLLFFIILECGFRVK